MDIKLSIFIGLWCLVHGLISWSRAEEICSRPDWSCALEEKLNECHQVCFSSNFNCSTCNIWKKECSPINITSAVPSFISPKFPSNKNLTTSRPTTLKIVCIENCKYTCVSKCQITEYVNDKMCTNCSVNCTNGCEGNANNCTLSANVDSTDHLEVVAIVVPLVIIVIVLGILIVVFIIWKRQYGEKEITSNKPVELTHNKKKYDEERGMLHGKSAGKNKCLVQDNTQESNDLKTRYATDPTLFRKVDGAISSNDSDPEIYVNVPSQTKKTVYLVDNVGRSSDEEIAYLPSPPPVPVPIGSKTKFEPSSWNDFAASNENELEDDEIYHLPRAFPIPVSVNKNETKNSPPLRIEINTPAVPEKDMDIYENVVYKHQPEEEEDHYYTKDPVTEEMYENLQSKNYFNK